jgi:hypothetical protein
MIGCPYCGTMNRKGSRYCSKCGERLDTVPSTRCPSCNAPNLSSNEYCAFCGGSLNVGYEEPETSIPPGIPAGEPTGEAEIEEAEIEQAEPEARAVEEIPSWLYNLPTDEEEVIVSAATGPALPEQEEPEHNRYLQDIGGAFPKKDGWVSQSLARHLATARKQGEPPQGA